MPDIKEVLRARVEHQNFTGLKPAAELAEKFAELYLDVSEANRINREVLLAEMVKRDAFAYYFIRRPAVWKIYKDLMCLNL